MLAATELLAQHGYDATTLSMVSQKSGAAIGSIVHFYEDKAGLARGVYEAITSELAAVVRPALQGRRSNVATAVRDVIAAVDSWLAKNPSKRWLLGILALQHSSQEPGWFAVDQHFAEAIDEWAGRRKFEGSIKPLSSPQLCALMLGPLLFHPDHDRTDRRPWLEALAQAAVAGMAEEKTAGERWKSSSPQSPAPPSRPAREQGELL